MLVKAKELSNISFDSISKGRRPDLLLYHNTQSMKRILILLHEEDEIFRGEPPPWFHHPSEILRMVYPFLSRKTEGSFHIAPQSDCSSKHCPVVPLAHLPSSWILGFTQLAFFSPLTFSFLKHFGHFWYSSFPKIRGSFFAWDYWVDTFFSWNSPLLVRAACFLK